ncbi:MAG: twin-arginine translocase TatA/TatE family subunit, partial [Helicobacter sp.]|nr:twin-arginine translocase TatA/TatE family subunit [Helicobacter sp.]
MGFMEILLIAAVAIIALGPEKLPQAMIDAA